MNTDELGEYYSPEITEEIMEARRTFWPLEVSFAVFGLAIAIIIILAIAAHAHDWKRPDLDGWYSSLKKPSGFQCCSKNDCHETEAELRGNDWWARIGFRVYLPTNENPYVPPKDRSVEWEPGPWVKVPQTAVLLNQGNPTGNAVICQQPVSRDAPYPEQTMVWCFIPPSES